MNKTPNTKRQRKLRELELRREKQKRLCEKSFYEFFIRAWAIVEPTIPLVDNWHIKFLCDVLQAEIHRIGQRLPKTKDIIINIPPRSFKSSITSVMLPAWAWIHYPHLKFISSSHSKDLSLEHCLGSRDLIQSGWYQRNWGRIFRLSGDQNVKGFYRNNKTGRRVAVSVGSKIAGKGADVIIADDLLDIEEADSETARNNANNHYTRALYTRLNDQTIGLRIIVQQRLHEDDPTGNVLKIAKEDYRHINIPAELTAESRGTEFDVSPRELERFYVDGLFFPKRFTRAVLDGAKKLIGSLGYACQFLQRVSTPGGNIFHRKDFKFYSKPPAQFEKIIQAWDMSFKEGQDNSFVVGQVWGRAEQKNYLLYQYRKQVGFSEARRAIVMVSHLYPHARKIYVEDKANGPAIVDSLEKAFPNLELYNPGTASKGSKWLAVSPIVEMGAVYVPDPVANPWVLVLLDECDKVPNATFNDQADALAIALTMLEGKTLEKFKKFLKF